MLSTEEKSGVVVRHIDERELMLVVIGALLVTYLRGRNGRAARPNEVPQRDTDGAKVEKPSKTDVPVGKETLNVRMYAFM